MVNSVEVISTFFLVAAAVDMQVLLLRNIGRHQLKVLFCLLHLSWQVWFYRLFAVEFLGLYHFWGVTKAHEGLTGDHNISRFSWSCIMKDMIRDGKHSTARMKKWVFKAQIGISCPPFLKCRHASYISLLRGSNFWHQTLHSTAFPAELVRDVVERFTFGFMKSYMSMF